MFLSIYILELQKIYKQKNNKKNMSHIKIIDLTMDRGPQRAELFQILYEGIHSPQHRKTLQQLYQNHNPNAINIACLRNETMVGGAIGGHLNNEVTYWNFFFVPEIYRKLGCGQIILDGFETRVKQDNRKKIEFEVEDPRVAEWFAKRGYREIQNRKNYEKLLNTYKQLTMTKEL